MSFWETHKNALAVVGLGLFVLLVGYFTVIRPASAASETCRQAIAEKEKKLADYYPELKDPNNVHRMQTIQDVQEACRTRHDEYGRQLKQLKDRLRFPVEDFEYIQKLKSQERPGIYLSSTYTDVKFQLHKTAMDRNVPEMLERDWMGFSPPAKSHLVYKTPADVPAVRPAGSEPAVIAEEELRKLCLAEQVTQLAINAGISRILTVKPLGKTEEAATRLRANPAYKQPGGKEPEKIVEEYPNRFIFNYPVSAAMIGSPEAVMKFFHSVRQEKRFLVISSFRIVSREDRELSADVVGRMRPGDVFVEISAACMDFKEGETKYAPPVPQYVLPTGPIGA